MVRRGKAQVLVAASPNNPSVALDGGVPMRQAFPVDIKGLPSH